MSTTAFAAPRPIAVPGFLRKVLLADALASGVMGLLLAAAAGALAPLLGLPVLLLREAGLLLLPYAALVGFCASRTAMPRWAVVALAWVNALWTIDSIALLLSGWVTPTVLGEVFVLAQAVVVGGFAALQYGALRRQ